MERKMGTHAMKRVAAGASLPISWLFEPAIRPENRADYCLDYCTSFYRVSNTKIRFRELPYTRNLLDTENGRFSLLNIYSVRSRGLV